MLVLLNIRTVFEWTGDYFTLVQSTPARPAQVAM
jgi:hypothetical protein